MRKLVIMRGLPGCGKSTFIKEHNLEAYTVSSDNIRLLVASTNMNIDGTIGISQKEDKWVWEKIYEILEIRFQKGLFTVFDATNIRASDLTAIKQIANKYNYEIYCVDMTDVSVDVIKERNKNRDSIKIVPDTVINKMNDRLKNATIPAGITVVKPENFDEIFFQVKDVSKYDAVHFIGDVHGCYDALIKLIDGKINENELYVFCGDYLDRGIQNAETLKFLIEISSKKNVVFLRGNHEAHLINYVNGNKVVSDVFRNETAKDIDDSGIGFKKIRRFCDGLKDCFYATYCGKKLFACHGGISTVPERIDFVASTQMVRGVGRYTDCEEVESTFEKTCPDMFLMHGHRNVTHESIRPRSNVFNLENAVEFGGTLRMVTFTKNDIITKEVVNTTFRNEKIMKPEAVESIVTTMRNNEYIIEKEFGDVSSFNFSRKAFEKGIWDKQTITARGLYIDTKENKIVARSYNKFFRIDEVEETQKSNLKNNISFPVIAYRKENGFLGIFSSYNGEPFFATKSSIDGDFNQYFKDIMYAVYGKDKINEFNFHCNKHNCTMVFEVIDIVNDPHIIRYEKSNAILLDIISNDIKFEKLSYKELVEIANTFEIPVKQKEYIFYTYKDFDKFLNSLSTKNDLFDENQIEGYVFEDNKGFMFKAKTEFYNFWKFMRGITSSVMKYGKYKHEDAIQNECGKQYYCWITDKFNNGIYLDSDKIIEIRQMFKAEEIAH